MALSESDGQLVIIGGAEDKEGDCKILREFIRRAGGLKAQIVVMTVATEMPREVGDDYIRVFERLGVEEIQIIDTLYREDANAPRALEAIRKATGVFFTGGDQARITSILKDTEIDRLLHKRLSEGIVIAGTSAGAAMMPDMMIVEGDSQTNPRVEIVKMEPGMGFLPGVVIDQHFAERGRIGRLLSAIAQQPVTLGFGIDENTAAIVRDNELEVVGEGAVTVVDMADITYSNLSQILRDEDLALCGVKLHILPHGYRFDLGSKMPILAEDTSTVEQKSQENGQATEIPVIIG
ncbi:cyanophycinase [Lyngbya aestuarii]|uniref:cyanophycinase n=1 Tax=Lyngbya aestuarii TaxID=118322 RepID=UPI00403D62AF